MSWKVAKIAFLATLTFLTFKAWFSFGILASGDLPYYFHETLNERFSLPLSWNGGYKVPLLFYWPPNLLTGLLSQLGFTSPLVTQLIWFWPFLVLTIFSSWFLFKTIFPKNSFWFISLLVFLFNTYILMIVGGAQTGIAWAYAFSPLVFALFIKLSQEPTTRLKIITGLVLAAQTAFDPRFSLIILGAVFFYAIFLYGFNTSKYFGAFVLPILITIGIHFYWLLPTILVNRSALPSGYGEVGWVDFLSFASFSNSFSLLHPNWPENIFGKVSFMKPEFLVVPILAYLSLFFVNLKLPSSLKLRRTSKTQNNLTIEQFNNKNILFFALLGLVGAFLAKGSNPPFGEIYLWLFNNFPGMSGFRDPTKFYTLVALSYSILIPVSVSNIYDWLKSRNKFLNFNFQNLFFLFTIFYLLFLIRQALMGQLGGTFKTHNVPKEYVQLKELLSSQPEFFRTLWVPRTQNFGFFSNNHPMLSSENLISPTVCQFPLCLLVEKEKKPAGFDSSAIPEAEILEKVRDYSLSYLNHPKAPEVLVQMGVKYIIVPYDSESEIFLRDRKYSEEEREKYIKILDGVSWLKKINSVGKIAIYETPKHNDRFFTIEKDPTVDWKMINPTKYVVKIRSAAQPFNLVFSENYDSLWQAKVGNEIIPSTKMFDLNSFSFKRDGNFDITIEFGAQKYVYWGGLVSLGTLTASLFFLFRKNK